MTMAKATRKDYEHSPGWFNIMDPQTQACVFVKPEKTRNDRYPNKWQIALFRYAKKFPDENRTYTDLNQLTRRLDTFFKYAFHTRNS